jgi:hypothetical protein
MQLQAAARDGGGVILEQDPDAVIAQAGPAGMRADVMFSGPTRGYGPAAGQEQRASGA